jgi:outer membrane protein assembly factor BamB/enterochelin esterase-like enzyme
LRQAALLVLLVTFTSSTAAAQAWPRWRGAHFDGTATSGRHLFDSPFELRVRWKRALGAGYSGVVVAGGHAVTMFSDGTTDFVVSLVSKTGAEEWRVPLGAAFPGRDGSAGGPVSTPAIDGDTVYALGPRGDFVAIALNTGKSRWRVQIADTLGAAVPHWGFTTSPLVTRDTVVVLTGGSPHRAITAFDKRTGTVVWQRGSDGASYQSPVLATVAGTERVVVGGDQFLVALDPADGREIWRYEHTGRGFYGQIINPVAVAPDQTLLTYRPDESVLLNTAAQPQVLWTTRELKLNYSTPVAFDGKVFGYSGAFLTCIDAKTGALLWRSRPPGDGFAIVVDGHLVVLTKNGGVTVAPARGDGFRPKASLDVFSRLVWTPPSFAEGSIFARDSYSEVAAIDIVPSAATTTAVATIAGVVPQSAFARWVAEVDGAPDAATRVRNYLDEHPTFPVIEGDRYAHFLYVGPVSDVALRGDMLEFGASQPLKRIGTTDVYYASFELAPDTRLAYQFVRNHDETIADPRNQMPASSLSYAGPTSLLLMPRAERLPAVPREPKLRGRVVEVEIETAIARAEHLRWGGKRNLHVYLPPAYDASTDRYPTIYVMYGEEMRRDGHLDVLLDAEFGNKLQPAIVVFVESTNAYEYARTFREAHRRMLVENVVPKIDREYRTRTAAADRYLLGADEGGFAVLETGLLFPQVFGNVVAQSAFPLSKGDEEMFALIHRSTPSRQRFHLDWGKYDPRRQADLLDVPGFTKQVRDRLAARGFTATGREWPDGSAVPLWSDRALEALQLLLPMENR